MSSQGQSTKIIKWAFLMLGFMFLTHAAWALPSLVLSSNAQTFYEGQNEMFVDPTVVISGNSSDVIDGVRIIVATNYSSTTDLLFCVNPLSFTVAFDSTKGILAIDGSGNIQNYQTVLRSVKYKNTQGNITATSLKNITMSLGQLLAFKGPDHSTYHYYQYVSPAGGYDWTQSRNAAAAATHFGLQGYLITVTSAAENDFANTKFTQNIWMGASDVGIEGTWKWVTGPESGNVFWMGKSTGTSVGGYYKNWYSGEPNDFGTGEDYAHFWASKNGQWNDFPHGNKLSYIIEYGGMVGDPVINLVDSVMTTVQENRTPTNIKLSDFDPAIFDYVSTLYESTNPPNWFTKVWVTDPDYHATLNPNELHDITFESSGLFPDNNKFSLSGNAYDGYTLTATGVFSYATQTSAHIRLRATEINGEKKHVKIDIVIPINDQPDPPTITTGLNSVTVNEDSGLLTQSITFADPDTVAANLIVVLTSGNTDLVSSANLTIIGSGFTRTVSMTPTANAYGTVLISVTCQDDPFGSMATSTMTLTVNPVNDAPTHSTLSPVTINEDATITFNGTQRPIVNDIDIGLSNMEISLLVSHGQLNLSQITGLTFSVGDGVSDANILFQGSLNNVNSALNGLVYVSDANYAGTDTLLWKSSDLGNSGSGGIKSYITAVAITMTSINDAPILVAGNVDLSVIDEDSPAGSGNTWQSILDNSTSPLWKDHDAGDPSSYAIVGSDQQNIGTWQTSVDGGVTWITLPSVTENSALLLQAQHRFRFVANSNAFGQANLMIKAWDGSNGLASGVTANTNVYSATGAYSSNILILRQTIRSINDAPSWSVPNTVSTNEDVAVVLGAMVLSDIDLGQSSANVFVRVWNGTLTLSSLTGLAFSLGDGTSDNSMIFSANTQNIQLALASSQFTPLLDFNGTALVQVSGNDLGISGFGGVYASTASVIVLTSEVNDPPALDLNVQLAFVDQWEDQVSSGNRVQTVLTSPATLVNAYSDVDRLVPTSLPLPDGVALSSWSSNNGHWQVSNNAGGTWTNFPTDDGREYLLKDDSSTLIRFLPLTNYYGTQTLKVRAWDQTQGSSGSLTTVTTPGQGTSAFSGNQSLISLNIRPLNDMPQIFTPAAPLIIQEDAQVIFSSAGNNLSLYDVESTGSNSTCALNLYSTQGNMIFSTLSGINSTGTSSNIMLSGNISDLNKALDGMQWKPYKDYFGNASVIISFNDQDISQNLPLTVTANVGIQVLPVNDSPVIGPWNSTLTYMENSPLALFQANALNILDVDDVYLQSANVQVSHHLLTEDLLTVTIASTSISSQYDSASGVLTLSGVETVANYKAVINSLIFNHLSDNPDREGTAPNRKLLLTLYDASSSANLELQMAIQALNDAPQIASWDNTPKYKEDDVALVLDSTVILTDPDNTFLQTVQIQLTPFIEGDKLEATATANLAISWNSSSGRLTLSGPAKPSEYSGVLQAMTYISNSSDPDQKGLNPSRTCELTANDGISSANASLIFTVQSFNDAPSLSTPFSISGNEDQNLAFATSPITVVDVDDVGGELQLSLEVSHGNLMLPNTVGLTLLSGLTAGSNVLVLRGSKSALNASLLSMIYMPEENYNGSDSLRLVVDDLGNSGTGGALEYGKSVAISITPVNDAPILPPLGIFTLNSIDEEDTNSAGNELLSLLTVNGNLISSDVDLGTSFGIAVTTNPSILDGLWQYSLNAGGFWQDLPAVSFNSAVLLGDYALLRFVPRSNFNGSANLIFHIWDNSSGHSSGASGVALGTTGGQSAFSINTGEISVLMKAVNDQPILTVPPLQKLLEDNNKTIMGISLQDVDLLPTDMVQITMSVSRGTLSVGGGLPSSTLFLTDTLNAVNQQFLTGIVYRGLANEHGTVSLNMTASDLGQHGTGGTQVASGLVILNIDEVNDAPVLNTAFWSDNVAMLEDDTNHSGWAPGIWSNYNFGSVNDVDLNFGDNVWNNTGVAITALGSEVEGRWEQSLNKGGQWATIPSLNSGNVLLLSLQGDHRLRFVPEANANGNLQLKFRAWDRTVGVPGEIITLNGTGESFAFSMAEKNMMLEVKAVNDAPTILTAVLPQTANEDENIVFRSSQTNGLRLEDVDLSQFPNSICQLQLSLSQANIQLGAFNDVQILDGNVNTTSLRISGNLSSLSHALNGLTLTPFKNWYGKDVLTMTLYDLGQIGLESLFHSIELNLIFLPVNDAPQWRQLDGDVESFREGDLYANLDTGNDLDIIDVDSSDFMGGRLEIIGTEQGSRDDRLLILADSDLTTTGGNLTYLGNLIGKWKDIGQGQAALAITFSNNNSSLGAVKSVAKNIRFTNASKNPSSGTRKFKWFLDDGDGGQARADVSLKVTAVNNDPDFVLTSGNSQIYREDQGSWNLFSGNLRLSDPDSLEFSGGIFVLEWLEGQSMDDRWTFSVSGNFTQVGAELRYLGLPFATILSNNVEEVAFKCRWLGSQATPERVLEMLAQLGYRNDSQRPDQQRRLLKMSIGDGDGGLSASQNVSFTLEAINDAPVLQLGGILSIPAILEDSSSSLGWTIAEILSREQNMVSDVDAQSVVGLALELLDTNGLAGRWEYRLEEGSWKTFLASSSSNLLLLRSGDRLRFTPARDWYGIITPAFMVRAWDRSTGAPGEWKTVTETGGTTAFSVQQRMLSLSVTGIPDDPVVVNGQVRGAKYANRPLLWSEFSSMFSDVDGDSLQRVIIDVLPTHGDLYLNSVPVVVGQVLNALDVSKLLYIPRSTFTGVDNFRWRAMDSQGTSVTSSVFSIEVLPIFADVSLFQNNIIENVGVLKVRVSLSVASTSIVRLELQHEQGSLLNYKDMVFGFGLVEFPVGTTIWEKDLIIIDDSEVEPTESTGFKLAQAQFCDIGVASVNLSVRDNDVATSGDLSIESQVITEWLDPAWVRESGTSARLSLRLSQNPIQAITMSLQSSDLGEGVLSTGSIMYDSSNWSIPQVVTVTGVPDSIVDGNIKAAVLISPSDSSYRAEPAVFTNIDTDSQGLAMLEALPLITSEDGVQTMLLFTLQIQPSSNVLLTAIENSLEHQLSSSGLIFTSQDWNGTQVLIVKGRDNAKIEGDRFVNLSWLPTVSNDIAASELRVTALDILQKDNDSLNAIQSKNLPPYRLILKSDVPQKTVNTPVMITFGAEDPELNMGIRGGMVDFAVDLNTGSGFKRFEALQATTFAMNFREAGIYKLELRAMDLLGAISLKQSTLVIHSQDISPFLAQPALIQRSAPAKLEWSWRDFVKDSEESSLRLIEWDFNMDGIIDLHGFPSDTRLNTVVQRIDQVGQTEVLLRVMNAKGEVFSLKHRIQVLASGIVPPVLTLLALPESISAPSTVHFQAKLDGSAQSISRIDWSFGEETETLWDISGNGRVATHSYQKPGTYTIRALALLSDGQTVQTRTHLHLSPATQPVVTWTGMSARLPWAATVGFGFPLQIGVWPPQAQLLNIQHVVAGQQGVSLNNAISNLNLGMAENPLNIQSSAQVSFYGANYTSSSRQALNYSSDFSSQQGPFAQSSAMALPWSGNTSIFVLVHDGSSIFAPLLHAQGQSVSMQLLKDSGLTTQGLPLNLRSIYRDVRFLLNDGQEIHKPTQPLVLELAYDDVNQDGLVDGYGVSENELVPMRFDHNLNRWVDVEYYMVHPVNNVVRVKTAHLSEFGLFMRGKRDVLTENNSGGGCFLR